MRAMSFMLTTQQVHDRTKTVTRRLGWKFIQVGQQLRAVEKCMGLKAGQSMVELAIVEVVSIRTEPLHAITDEEVLLEGFNMPASEFIEMFCKAMNCDRNQPVQRIEFKYVEEPSL